MERLWNCRPVFVNYECDVCKQGSMRLSGPPPLVEGKLLYPHICGKCGAKADLESHYPDIRWQHTTPLQETGSEQPATPSATAT